ncbi:MAG: imidazole glycerol phosphate synthase subunit HisH [Sphingobacterium sp.]|uniref:imidazole glycerol phosphate synthase subunit HisH n=1 Tax=Sphingobacterium sp. JB170 TaxID=1434842 RepID=UPI00097EBBC7|nr:imidazole glycerol phosphate synthase subunit HisH [Sphingobacterium sp. JB170]SJN33714.1 Imidazole glycerol phosphate synthase amidotransferase subunit [Sphingobacterium sp. JB170]
MIGIVNYGAGNIFSLTAALDRLNIGYGMINDQNAFDLYDHIIIPGVGHAGSAMNKLHESGLAARIDQLEQPVLGICVGMQLLTAFSEEGNSDLLNIMPIRTLHFDKQLAGKVPHMGWNSISPKKDSAIFQDIADKSYFYFVHSYYIEEHPRYTAAICHYGIDFSAAIEHNNFIGVQFHPEKSGVAGEQLLKNFSRL